MSEGLNYMRIVVLLGTYSSLMMQHVHHSLCKTGLNTIQLKRNYNFPEPQNNDQ